MKAIIIAAVVGLALALPSFVLGAPPDWAVGKFDLHQQYRTEHFNGRLEITRQGGQLTGRLYFDVVGKWEQLEGVNVTADDELHFTRPQYKQVFRGHRTNNGLEGSYTDSLNGGGGHWEAMFQKE
jgi:hypothetical protein